MYVKRVYAPTVREALAMARDELGPAALVLSTELVPAPGWRGWFGQRVVRLTAAAERGLVAAPPAPVAAAALSEDRTNVPADRQPAAGARAGVIARLVAAGMTRALAEAVTARMTDAECRGNADRGLRRALVSELEGSSAADAAYARYEVFVGPPGVGKTTTIAKIAAQECIAGGQALGLVSADGFRAGAIEQLRGYASVMGMPFRMARTAADFEQALGSTRHTALVDTAGRSPGDTNIAALFQVLERKRSVRTHVVLAADTSAATARRLLDRYAPLRPSRVVITKIDESDSMLPLFDAVRERGLPVSYLTAGQRVPEDLWRATPASLASALLGEPAMEEALCH
jgi:flagellar biosynthesis protein FlhF